MKRKKPFILIISLIAVVFISLSALCNQCSTPPSSTAGQMGTEETKSTETIKAQAETEEATDVAETTASLTPTTQDINQQNIEYKNTQYGFSFLLPDSWEGYSIITDEWEGSPAGSVEVIEKGPIISIRNPKWTKENPYQDIPIMVFAISQWESLLQEKFHIGAAPIGPSELGRNDNFVFALPARYNYAFPSGWEEVEKILKGNPLKTL